MDFVFTTKKNGKNIYGLFLGYFCVTSWKFIIKKLVHDA